MGLLTDRSVTLYRREERKEKRIGEEGMGEFARRGSEGING